MTSDMHGGAERGDPAPPEAIMIEFPNESPPGVDHDHPVFDQDSA